MTTTTVMIATFTSLDDEIAQRIDRGSVVRCLTF